MILLRASSLKKYFAAEPVLDGCSLEIRSGEKIGLVGPNGVGKTTLLRILAGEMESDGGELERAPSVTMGYLRQHAELDPHATVQQIAEDALSTLRGKITEAESLARQIEQAADDRQRRSAAERFDRLQHELRLCDAYQWPQRVDQVLCGLRFSDAQRQQPVGTLSGGQQNRLMLASLLLQEPDVMLLDEPSNHLDLAATEWLEQFLSSTKRAVVVVSHDRYLLDRVTQRTWELMQGTIDVFRGNYTAYQRQKQERLEIQRRTYEKQQEQIDRLQDFVRRNQYGQKHAQAEDRRKKLERMELVSRPREIALPPFFFPQPSRSGEIVIRAEGIQKAFDRPLFQNLTFDILRGQRWGILGPNGCGKTTLVRCLLGQCPLDAGRVILGQGVQPSYCDQHLSFLDPRLRVVDAVRPLDREMPEPARRSHLARFGLTGDSVFSAIGKMSGGERTRVALAYLSAQQANLLVLDEPTNHLDLWARQALEKALLEFEGTVAMISHDRYFLDRVADHLLVFQGSKVEVFAGNYSQYLHWCLARDCDRGAATSNQAPALAKRGTNPAKSNKHRGMELPTRRKRRFPFRKVEDIEQEITEIESRIQDLHRAMSAEENLRNGDRMRGLQSQLAEAEQRLAALYEHWEEAHEFN